MGFVRGEAEWIDIQNSLYNMNQLRTNTVSYSYWYTIFRFFLHNPEDYEYMQNITINDSSNAKLSDVEAYEADVEKYIDKITNGISK
jgi:hypothetical protein